MAPLKPVARLTNDSREPEEEAEDKIDDELGATNPSLEEYCQRRDEEGEHIEKEVVLHSPVVVSSEFSCHSEGGHEYGKGLGRRDALRDRDIM
jgi:hypothetical protein